MEYINQIVGENIRKYIEATGKSQKWVYEKAGMTRSVFYNLLNGQGDVMKNAGKIAKVFRIKDPTYFYNQNFEPLMSLEEKIGSTSITKKIAASYHGQVDDKDFAETLGMLDDFISMIDILENLNTINTKTDEDTRVQ